MPRDVGRLDYIITNLERLQKDATEILNIHIDGLLCNAAPEVSWGATKHRLVAPAGSTLNYVAALKLLREKLTGQK